MSALEHITQIVSQNPNPSRAFFPETSSIVHKQGSKVRPDVQRPACCIFQPTASSRVGKYQSLSIEETFLSHEIIAQLCASIVADSLDFTVVDTILVPHILILIFRSSIVIICTDT